MFQLILSPQQLLPKRSSSASWWPHRPSQRLTAHRRTETKPFTKAMTLSNLHLLSLKILRLIQNTCNILYHIYSYIISILSLLVVIMTCPLEKMLSNGLPCFVGLHLPHGEEREGCAAGLLRLMPLASQLGPKSLDLKTSKGLNTTRIMKVIHFNI